MNSVIAENHIEHWVHIGDGTRAANWAPFLRQSVTSPCHNNWNNTNTNHSHGKTSCMRVYEMSNAKSEQLWNQTVIALVMLGPGTNP
jgi:hypothetical protein